MAYRRFPRIVALSGTVLLVCCVLPRFAWSEFRADLSLTVNKCSFVRGEPILLRTCVAVRESDESVTVGLNCISWATTAESTYGFSLHLRRQADPRWHDFIDFVNCPFDVARPPDQFPWFHDSGAIRFSDLTAGRRFLRTDMLVLKEAGTFAAKTVLKLSGNAYQSNRVTFEILPIGHRDSITKVVPPDRVFDLAQAIYNVHCEGNMADTRLGSEETTLERITPHIVKQCPGSVFIEYVLYARARYEVSRQRQPHVGTVNWRTPVRAFVEAYPDSWLLPELLANVFGVDPKGSFGPFADVARPFLEADPEHPPMVPIKEYIEKGPPPPPKPSKRKLPADYDDGLY